MNLITIAEFANQIKLDPQRLVRQLSAAGVHGKTPSDTLDDGEKRQLLNFLRGGDSVSNRSTITRTASKFRKGQMPLSSIDERVQAELIKANYHLKRVVSILNTKSKKLLLEGKRIELIDDVKQVVNEEVQFTPKVFISYSYDSILHEEWVLDLAEKLRSNGVDTLLDKWALHPGDSITQFMEQGISDCDFVLIICTENYKTKSDSRAGGVGYEESIISSDLLSSKNQRKYVPILKSKEPNASIPIALKSKFYIDFSSSTGFDGSFTDLLLTLFNKRQSAPELGKPPEFKN